MFWSVNFEKNLFELKEHDFFSRSLFFFEDSPIVIKHIGAKKPENGRNI